MRRPFKTILPFGVALAFMAMVPALPAAAGDEPETAAATASSASDAMAWARAWKSKRYVRQVRGYPARVASLARPGCGWYVTSCDRPFVLILGISY
jgi:hypothetical protein